MQGLTEERVRRDFMCGGDPAPVWRLDAAGDVPRGLRCAVSIGAFDGFHTGHQTLVRALVDDARARGVAAVAVTFDPDPDCVVAPRPAKRLLAVNDRLRALSLSGVDGVLVVPFTRELAGLGHEAFFTQVLGPYLSIEAVHVGEDFRLGAGGTSTVEVIGAWGAGRGMAVTGHRLVRDGQQVVSATRIRALLAEGKVAEAAVELGRDHVLAGRVAHGRGEGSSLGFPTANIDVPLAMQFPANGVYAGIVQAGSVAYPAAINVGIPPTFADNAASARLEANLIGFEGDLYGSEVRVAFAERLRGQVKFPSLEELVATVRGNIDDVRRRFGDAGVRCLP